MDKKKIIGLVLKSLQENLDVLNKVAEEARQAATHEDAKAENKYDTRAIESSYLAGAQAKRADELSEIIYKIEKLEISTYATVGKIVVTHLVELEVDGEERWFILLPAAAGMKIDFEGKSIQVITPESPLGKKIVEKTVGHEFQLKIKDKSHEYEIMSCL